MSFCKKIDVEMPLVPREVLMIEATKALNGMVAAGGGYGHTYSPEEIGDIFGTIIDRIGRHMVANHSVSLGRLGYIWTDHSGVHLERYDYKHVGDTQCVVSYDRPLNVPRAYYHGQDCHCDACGHGSCHHAGHDCGVHAGSDSCDPGMYAHGLQQNDLYC